MMFGGLNKSASRLALVAAASVLATNAYAADLGGDCCADLEERVAELEATTARKGTRKTSLEIYGLINKEVISWRDGINRNTELGTDNVNQSTRFGFRGMAKISPQVTAGYSTTIEIASGGRSTNVTQFNDKQAVIGVSNPNTFGGQFGANDQAITMRESVWWIESKTIGRLTVGRLNTGADGGPTGAIDLGGIGLTAGGTSSVNDTGLRFRTNAPAAGVAAFNSGNFTGYSNPNTTDSNGEYATRQNAIMYTSPVLAGFTVTASLGNAAKTDSFVTASGTDGVGPLWSAGIKYAGEFSGVRVAASYGHETADNTNATSLFGTNGTSVRPKSTNDGFALSLMHIATGLFAQGFYNQYTRGHDAGFALATGADRDTARQWQIQAGISKNWFGIGNTALYGEYQRTRNGFNTFGLEPAASLPSTNAGTAAGQLAYFGDVTTNRFWGLGAVQYIDAAAMQLYAGYRNHSVASDNCTANGGCKDISVFVAGSRIQF